MVNMIIKILYYQQCSGTNVYFVTLLEKLKLGLSTKTVPRIGCEDGVTAAITAHINFWSIHCHATNHWIMMSKQQLKIGLDASSKTSTVSITTSAYKDTKVLR